MRYSRRQFIGSIALAGGGVLLTSCTRAGQGLSHPGPPLTGRADLPLDQKYSTIEAPRAFFGPNPHQAHPHLWKVAAQTGTSALQNDSSLPSPATTIQHSGPIVIGGGLSGLGAAYHLQDLNPLVLEASSHFGGNSQGQVWDGIPYSIGAAYFIKPEEGSSIYNLLSELHLLPEIRIPSSADEYAEGSSLKHGLWYGGEGTYGEQSLRVTRIYDYLKKLLRDEGKYRYPEIPTEEGEVRSYINRLDKEKFSEHLQRIAGGPIPYPLSTALEQYCWSAFAASSSEISAASGLNFLASELEEVAVLPGGNSRVTQRLCEELLLRLGDDALRSNEIVLNVRATETGVEVLSVDTTGKATLYKAPLTIVACPKFVAKRIIMGGSPERYKAMQKLKYRAYITANVVVKGHPSFTFYDLYLLHRNAAAASYPATTPFSELAATDVILANWIVQHPTDSVLTLYRAIPFDGGRVTVLDDGAYENIRRAFEKQITNDLLPLFNLTAGEIRDLRITRWGHALPVAEQNFIADGNPELLRAPLQEKIFFAQQDNWALPAFEVALYEAETAAKAARLALRSTSITS